MYIYIFFHIYITLLTLPIIGVPACLESTEKILEPDSIEMLSHSCLSLTSMPIDFIYPYLDK